MESNEQKNSSQEPAGRGAETETPARPGTYINGKWFVIGFLIFALLAATYATWRIAGRLTLPEEPPPATPGEGVQGLNEEQQQELEKIQEGFAHTVKEGLATDRVIAAARNLVSRAPNSYDARMLLAQAYLKGNKPDHGFAQLTEAIKLRPDELEPRLLVGTLAIGMKQPGLAEEHYRQALIHAPTNERARLHLAQLLMSKNQLDEALGLALAAAEYNTLSHQAQALVSEIRLKQGNQEEALKALNRAIDLTPAKERSEAVVYIRKQGSILRAMGRPEEALSALRKMTPEERTQIDALYEVALTLEQMNQIDESAMLCHDAALKNPTKWNYAALSAEWWIKAGDLAEARKQVQRLQNLQPGHAAVGKLNKQITEAENKAKVSGVTSGNG